MEVYVQPDASVKVIYEILFQNNPRARAIDVVDVGLFHGNYDISNMSASIDEKPLTAISRSSYIETGVEVKLGRHAIRPGQSGTFRFTATMPDMVFQDTTRDDYASLRVTPTWFGKEFVSGRTNLEIAIHMLPGIEPDEVLHQDRSFTRKLIYKERVVAYWNVPNWVATGSYIVGVSFPKRGMERVVVMTKWQLLLLWWEASPMIQLFSGGIIILVFSLLFFMLTASTGWSLWIVIVIAKVWLFAAIPAAHLISLPFWPFIFGLMFYVARKGKKCTKYLPPITSIEGGGIKRGLTAPEAAILLEMKPARVLTLVIFGLLKKGVLTLVKNDPLTVAVEEDFVSTRAERLAKAVERGVVLHVYEHAFLDEFARISAPVETIDLSEPFKGLVEHTVDRVTAFDVKMTRKYYENIIERAWSQAETLGEVEQRTSAVDRNLEWMLMRDNYKDGFGRWETMGYTYYPMWLTGRSYGRSPLATGRSGSPIGFPGAGRSGGSGGPSFSPGFKDVAASFTGWTENIFGQTASSIMPADIGMKSSALDLSSLDKFTANTFQALAESGGSGGGGGCACAGCACACACAGGGR